MLPLSTMSKVIRGLRAHRTKSDVGLSGDPISISKMKSEFERKEVVDHGRESKD